jgi:peptide/nickel transport system permease protein
MTSRRLAFFVARRMGALALLLVLISFGVFSLLYLAPGSVDQVLLGTRPSTPETLRAIRHEYHLDEPFLTQYWIWAKGALHLDFGRSVRTSEPVLSGIAHRFGVTAFLASFAFLIAMVGGIGLGVASALSRTSYFDRGIVFFSVLGVSAPAFATGILLLYLFAVVLRWFPAFGPGSGFADRLYHLTLPAIALALTAMALVVKLTRAGMIRALEQDYIVFARSRGLARTRILFSYALRNALIPVITGGGLILGYMLTGAVLVEVTFALPGIGSLLVDSVTFKDVPMVQGIVLLAAVVIVFVNLLTDLLYLAADPRIRADWQT